MSYAAVKPTCTIPDFWRLLKLSSLSFVHVKSSRSSEQFCIHGRSLVLGWVVDGQQWGPSMLGEVTTGP